ncbi:MAG: T9SS type A sorting domain-containing protein [Flavobacteriales bacterium]|nr:T9SS type A sorting domain-containing protein [Flavobacteriales bacterium]
MNSTTGVEENNATTALRIFPNPASTEVQVTTAQPGQVITLIDAQGREALRQVVNSSGRLDLSALEPGNYAVLLTNAARKVVARERLTIAR